MRTRYFFIILASFFCMFVQNMMAQVYSFTCKTLSNGLSVCEMEKFVSLSKDTNGKILIRSAIEKDCIGYIELLTGRDDIIALCNKATMRENNNNLHIKALNSCTLKVHLDNEEILSNNQAVFYDTRSDLVSQKGLVGLCSIGFPFHLMNSNTFSISRFDDLKRIQYVAQQLRTHSITKIVINGLTIEFDDFKTKDTFDSMFNELGEMIGEPDKFKYTPSSSSTYSSSSTPSITATALKPTATGNIGYLNVTPIGDIFCRIDDLNIIGAKGENVQVKLVFDYEDKEETVSIFEDNTTPSYDDSLYETFRIIGNVDEIKTLRYKNSARYGVYLWVLLDNGDGSFKTLAEIKHGIVTIYKDGSGWALR